MLQGDKLEMLGLGVSTSTDIDPGIHLRWHFDAEEGFPKFGFDLFRRQHVETGDLECLPIETLKLSDPIKVTPVTPGRISIRPPQKTSFSYANLTFTSTPKLSVGGCMNCPGKSVRVGDEEIPQICKSIMTGRETIITVKSSAPLWEFTITEIHPTGKLSLDAYDGSILVASAQQKKTGVVATVTVAADRFDKVVINAPPTTEVCTLCWLTAESGAELAGLSWQKLRHFDLPLNLAEARKRIDSSLYATYATPAIFFKMKTVIDEVIAGSTKVRYPRLPRPTPLLKTPATFSVNPVKLLLIAAIDPVIARILGLYYLDDSTATETGAFDYKIVGNWSAVGSADHAWICYGLSRSVPPDVSRPTGLAAEQREVVGGIMTENGASAKSQVAAALTWDIPRGTEGGLTPTAAVLYHIERQKQHGSSWGRIVELTAEGPVVVGVKDDKLPTYFYTDGPLDPATYRYRVRGVDIFGRLSNYSRSAKVELIDNVAPPPPTDVAAEFSDEDSTDSITVTWKWPEQRREQASDAAKFRVYYQVNDLYPVEGLIESVSAGKPASVIVTDLDATADYTRFKGGSFVHRGKRYPVDEITTTGSKVGITVENLEDDDGEQTVTPEYYSKGETLSYLVFQSERGKVLNRFLLLANWADTVNWKSCTTKRVRSGTEDYEAKLSGITVNTDSGTPTAPVYVAVCTEDDAGNVGPLSTPIVVTAAHKTAPKPPSFGGLGDQYATRADYYGKSRYTIEFSGENDVYYDIYRATDSALAAVAEDDRAQSEINDDKILEYADDPDNASAFVKMDARDADGNVLGGTAGTISYTAEFSGTGRNRYVFEVQPYDAAGNRGDMSSAQLVHLYDVKAPHPPVIASVVGGDRQITLNWAANRERDLAGYRVYRTTLEAWSSDIRSMDMVSEIAAGTQTYTDAVDGLMDYYYRLVAYDTEGNVSPATEVLQGKPYDASIPEPPAWLTYSWDAAGSVVSLEWELADAAQTALVQRRKLGSDTWQTINSGWLPAGTSSTTDSTASNTETYAYRILVRGMNQLTNDEYVEVTVTYSP